MDNLEELFEIKQKFLRVTPHPKLIKKQIDKLDKLVQEENDIRIITSELDTSSSLADYLENYIAKILKIRLEIANAKEAVCLKNNLKELLLLQESLILKLASYAEEIEITQFDNVKMSDDFGAYAILKFIRVENIEENKIKPYLYTQINTDLKTEKPLLIACVRAKKILEYDR